MTLCFSKFKEFSGAASVSHCLPTSHLMQSYLIIQHVCDKFDIIQPYIYTKLYRYNTLLPLHNNQINPMEGIICLLKYDSIADKEC